MKVGIVIYSSEPETVWNAFRFANFAVAMGDKVKIFLLGKGVECRPIVMDTDKFQVTEQLQTFLNAGGKIFVCGTCLEIHRLQAPETFITSTLKDMYEIVKESDKIITL